MYIEDDLEVISHATSYEQVQIEYEVEENTENDESMDNTISSKLRASSLVPKNNTADKSGGKLTQVVSAFGLSENKALITYNFKSNWNFI